MTSLKLLKNQRGLTLVELLGSIVILSIILVSFLGFFIQSARTTKVSGDIIDASYIAQQQAEEIYNYSNDQSYSELTDYLVNTLGFSYSEDHFSIMKEGHEVNLTLEPTDNEGLYSLLIKVYDSDDKQGAQVETKFFFDEVGAEADED